jgi:hypothetical protein
MVTAMMMMMALASATAAAAMMMVATKKAGMTDKRTGGGQNDKQGLRDGCALLTRCTREAMTTTMVLQDVQTLLMMMSQ